MCRGLSREFGVVRLYRTFSTAHPPLECPLVEDESVSAVELQVDTLETLTHLCFASCDVCVWGRQPPLACLLLLHHTMPSLRVRLVGSAANDVNVFSLSLSPSLSIVPAPRRRAARNDIIACALLVLVTSA